MTQSFGAREPAVARPDDRLNQPIPCLIERHLTPQDAGDVEVDVLGHRSRRLWIGGELDHGLDGIADDVALPGWKQVHDETCRRLQRDALRGRRRGVHVIKPGTFGGGLGRFQHVDKLCFPADLLQIAEGLFLDGRQPAADVPFRGLRFRQIVRLVTLDDCLIVIEDAQKPLPDFRAGGAARADDLGAGEL